MWVKRIEYNLKTDANGNINHRRTDGVVDDASPLALAVEAAADANPGRVILGVGDGGDSIHFVGPMEGL